MTDTPNNFRFVTLNSGSTNVATQAAKNCGEPLLQVTWNVTGISNEINVGVYRDYVV